MFEEIKTIDETLYYRFEDVTKAISSYSRSVFVTMQSCMEYLIKASLIRYNKQYASFQKLSLGNLLNEKLVKSFLEFEYEFSNLNSLYVLNNLGNQYKHSSVDVIQDQDVIQTFQIIYDYINAFLFKHNFPTMTSDYMAIYKKLTTENNQLEHQYNESILEKESIISKLTEEIQTLYKEKNIYIENLEKIDEKKNEKEKAKKEFDSLTLKIETKRSILSNLEEKRRVLVSNLRKSTTEQYELLSLENKKVTTEILDLEYELLSLEEKRNVLNEFTKQDVVTVNENKYKVIIEELQQKITLLELRFNDMNQKAKPYYKESSFESKSKIVEAIRFNNHKQYFGSNYVVSTGFEISNITLANRCQSRYHSLFAVMFNLLNRGRTVKSSKVITSKYTSPKDLDIVYKLEILILSLLKEGILDDGEWHLNVENRYQEYLYLAIEDIFYIVGLLASISKTIFIAPTVCINDNDSNIYVKIEFDTSNFNDRTYIIFSDVTQHQPVPVWIAPKIEYTIDIIHNEATLLELLEMIFGFHEFKPNQMKIIANYLTGRSTIGILPTGGGKSLTYYFSVLLQPKTALIVAPINSLIKDQNDKLRTLFGIDRTANLTGDNHDMYADLTRFKKGEVLFTFASPERAQSKIFRDILVSLSYNKTIGTVVLDEVHCLSEWGHDFRIPYLMLSETLNSYCEGTSYLGLTATASVNVVKDLLVELRIKDKKDIIFSENLKRTNLSFCIKSFSNLISMKDGLKNFVISNYQTGNIYDVSPNGAKTNAAIIFTKTVKGKDLGVVPLYNSLSFALPEIVGQYYGDFKDQQDGFMNNEISLLVATKAFGMGVDKPNIRFTIHYGMPSSREAFYQEAGRAGRDDASATCFLYTYENDILVEKRIDRVLNLQTQVPEIIELQSELSWKSDISTNLFFLTENLEEPQEEAVATIEMYNYFVTTNSKVCRLQILDNEKNKKEKILYILHKVGIVYNWYVEYQGRQTYLCVEVNSDFRDIEHIVETTISYLKPYAPNPSIISEIYKVKKIEQLANLIFIVRGWYHDTFIRARREQLANMYSFVKKYKNQDSSKEIQEELDMFFNIKDLIGENEEGFDFTFSNNTFPEVVKYAFSISEDKLFRTQIAMEQILESVVNTKVDIFTSLVVLRLGLFIADRNGKERFEYGLKNMGHEDFIMLFDTLMKYYPLLSETDKYSIIESLSTISSDIVYKISELIDHDDVSRAIICSCVNDKLSEMWRN